MRRNTVKRIMALCLTAMLCGAFLQPTEIPKAVATDVSAEDETIGGGYAVTGQLENVGYLTELYNAENGLPTSDANYVYSAHDGVIWIGGYSGIIRYDGKTFERLDSTQGLTSGRIIFEDDEDRMWFGTNDNGIVILQGGEMTRITQKEGLPSSSIRGINQCADGTMVVATSSGIVTIDREMHVHLIEDHAVVGQYILRMVSDVNGKIYAVTRGGDILCIENGNLSETCSSAQIDFGTVVVLYPDPKAPENLYFGTMDGRVFYGRLGQRKNQLKEISVKPMEGEISWITSACGRIWINTYSASGYLDANYGFHVLRHISLDNSIEMMTPDYQGNLWYASSRQGVMKIVTCPFAEIMSQAGLEPMVVNSTCMRDDKLYIGGDMGLTILTEDSKPLSNELTEFIGNTRIRCIIRDPDDNLWICTFTDEKGLICYTPDERMIHYTMKEGLVNNETRCATVLSDGTILVGTNAGLSFIKDGKVVKNIDESSGMVNAVILSVEEGTDGTIYAASDGNGIHVIEGDEIRDITRDDGLTSDVILRVKHDPERNVDWLITSNSIQYIRDGKVKNVSTFPYNNNFDLYFGDNDNIWILSSYGIFCMKADDMLEDHVDDYRLYTLANGLPGIPTGNSFSELTEDGVLYVSERNGVCRMNINSFFDHNTKVRMSVKSVVCDGDSIEPDEDGRYTIPKDVGRIQISVEVLDYTLTNPTLRIFLENSGDEGITVPQNKLTPLEYTSLHYGTYPLQMQIIDPETGSVKQEETVWITKKPGFFEMTVVWIIGVALIVLLAVLFVWRLMNSTVVRRQYQEILQARDDAEQANMAKSRFLANMSHEIRTPINTIMGMDEMLLREEATDVPKEYHMAVVNYALDIRTASESLLNLISDILDISKIESGRMHLVEQDYDTTALLRSIVTMIRTRAEQKELRFDVIVDEDLPRTLHGDSGKIKQVILNLLTNAVKYTNVGGFTLTVKVESKDEKECNLRISVQDTGIGIKKEDLERLFVAYERLDEENNTGIQGTGLGLDISRRFVELMGGRLWCESEYGEGSEFILTVSQSIVDEERIGEFSEHEEEMNRGPYVPQFIAPEAEILVVDDNPMNLEVMRNLLKATRAYVTTSESGEDCLEKIRYGSYDVVLLDHMMPGMDGIETLERIRETHPDLPVYALTANAASGADFYLSKGFTGYLSKPVDSLELEKSIMKHLPEEIMQKPSEDMAYATQTELPEEMNWVKELDGITVNDGIRASGGVPSYISALGTFYDTIEPNAKAIEDAYENGDIRMYTVKVHSLKSSARIIGAGGLAALAERLEKAGNDEDMSLIQAETEHLLTDLREFRNKLAPLREKPEEDDREPIPEKDLADAYRALKEVVPQMDYDSAEMILDQLKEYRLPEEDQEKCEALSAHLKNFEWEKMEELLG